MVYTIVVHLYAKDDKESISKLKAKLVEASQVYSKDKETLSWFVMQDVSDERKFTIVERYLKESVCNTSSFETIHHQVEGDCGVKLLTHPLVANIPPQQPVLEDL
jgi:hypothetical protein